MPDPTMGRSERRYQAWRVLCPECVAPPGERCHGIRGVHRLRDVAFNRAMNSDESVPLVAPLARTPDDTPRGRDVS